jgi:A-kinase anchor protein 10
LAQKQDIIRGICTENGQVDLTCFDATRDHLMETLERTYYPDFIQSAFYAKHQLEVFTCDGGSGVTIKGLLTNDMLLFHFMEFMESEGKSERALLEFWMTTKNFRLQHRAQDQPDQDHWQSDAMLIYEKFVSLQASNPLGFSTSIRSRIELAICSVDGLIDSCCFMEAVANVEAFLQTKYMAKFLASPLFSSYLSELMTIIEKAGVASTSTTAAASSNERHRSASGSSLNTTCSSETMSTSLAPSISIKNTLLASDSSSRRSRRRPKSPDFLDKSTNPDHLWQRNQTMLTNIGHVDHLGRYISFLELPPDVQPGQKVLSGLHQPSVTAKITKVVRKMMVNDDVEKFREEMAWQMAEMIVTDVTNRSKLSSSSMSEEDQLSSLGTPTTPSKLPLASLASISKTRKTSSS